MTWPQLTWLTPDSIPLQTSDMVRGRKIPTKKNSFWKCPPNQDDIKYWDKYYKTPSNI